MHAEKYYHKDIGRYMRVKMAKSAGFCMGVKQALDMVLKKARSTILPIYTYGPLIHNPQVLEALEKKGINILGKDVNLKELEPSMVIVRTHGITPSERKDLKDNVKILVDGTCPRVAKVQGIIKKSAHDGYFVVIIGDKNHAEVVALLAYAGDKGLVIDGPSSVGSIPKYDKICVVSQTTQSRRNFENTVAGIMEHFPGIEVNVKDTLCDFTSRRQAEVESLAKEVDALVVVGGKNSANTARLAMIAEKTGKPTYWVETEKELDPERMKRYFTVGVTAGASAPNWVINRVVETLEDTIPFGEKKWKAFLKIVSTFLVRSCLFLAMGAVFLTYVSAALQGIAFNIYFALVPFFYVLSMHILNHYIEQDSMKYNEPTWYDFFQKYKNWLLNLGAISAILSLYFAFQAGMNVLILMTIACIAAGMYESDFLPEGFFKYSGIKKLRDLPASKDFSVSLAWSVIITLVPLLGTPSAALNWGTVAAFSFSFTSVFFRSILYDMKDIQGDALVSRETLPIIIGSNRARYTLIVLVFFQSALLLLMAEMSLITSLGYYLLISMLYCCLYLYLFYKDIISRGNNIRMFVEGEFFLAGILAMIWKFS